MTLAVPTLFDTPAAVDALRAAFGNAPVTGARRIIGGFSGALPAMWGDLKGLRKDEARAIFQPFIIAHASTKIGQRNPINPTTP